MATTTPELESGTGVSREFDTPTADPDEALSSPESALEPTRFSPLPEVAPTTTTAINDQYELGLYRTINVLGLARSSSTVPTRDYRALPDAEDITLDESKQRLVSGNRDGTLRLARADLVEAMNLSDVQESEVEFTILSSISSELTLSQTLVQAVHLEPARESQEGPRLRYSNHASYQACNQFSAIISAESLASPYLHMRT